MSGKKKAPKEKMNLISAFFYKRKVMKKRKQFFEAKIGKEKFEPFLKEVEKALTGIIADLPDKGLFLDRIGEETTRWLNDMPDIKLASFKAGACYGVYLYCRIKQEKNRKETYVV